MLKIVAKLPLESADGRLVPLVECPRTDPLGDHETGPSKCLHVSRRRWLRDSQLVRDVDHTDSVTDEVPITLRRKVCHRVAQPPQDLQSLGARERSHYLGYIDVGRRRSLVLTF